MCVFVFSALLLNYGRGGKLRTWKCQCQPSAEPYHHRVQHSLWWLWRWQGHGWYLMLTCHHFCSLHDLQLHSLSVSNKIQHIVNCNSPSAPYVPITVTFQPMYAARNFEVGEKNITSHNIRKLTFPVLDLGLICIFNPFPVKEFVLLLPFPSQ